MKKIIVISLVSLSMIGLTGCGAQELADKVENVASQEQAAETGSVQNDVRNTAVAVTTYIINNPAAKDLSGVKVVATGDNTVIIKGTPLKYTIVGNTPAGATFTYDSSTGVFK